MGAGIALVYLDEPRTVISEARVTTDAGEDIAGVGG